MLASLRNIKTRKRVSQKPGNPLACASCWYEYTKKASASLIAVATIVAGRQLDVDLRSTKAARQTTARRLTVASRVDDRLCVSITTKDDQQVRHHLSSAFVVKLHNIFSGKLIQCHLYHSNGSVHDPRSSCDNG